MQIQDEREERNGKLDEGSGVAGRGRRERGWLQERANEEISNASKLENSRKTTSQIIPFKTIDVLPSSLAHLKLGEPQAIISDSLGLLFTFLRLFQINGKCLRRCKHKNKDEYTYAREQCSGGCFVGCG